MLKTSSMVYKTMVVGVIVLIIGIGIQPAFATIHPENIDVEYYDVTTEFIGLDSNHTIQLTKEEIQELDALFVSFRHSLNNSESYEDTIELYNDMISKLDTYRLFGQYSIKQVQELVTGRFQKKGYKGIMGRLYDKILIDDDSNWFCLISGSASGSFLIPFDAMIADFLIYFLDEYYPNLLSVLFEFLWMYCTIRAIFYFPIRPFLLSGMALGAVTGLHEGTFHPATGWIHTQSRLYERDWNGSFYGKITQYPILLTGFLIGVIGFKGIEIDIRNLRPYYLGSATYIKISYDPY